MKIKYNIHILNDDGWPAVDEDDNIIGNYLEWEAEEWEAENGEVPPQYAKVIDKICAKMSEDLGLYHPGEVIGQILDTNKVDQASRAAASLGRLSWAARKGTQDMSELAKKRWSKNKKR